MSDATNPPSDDSGSEAIGSSDRSRDGRRRRKLWIVSGSIAAVLVLLGLAIFVLPTFAARWLLDSTLEDARLEASGIKTIDIDLWNREVWFGPIAIGKPGSEPARLERFGLVFSISQLLERRGLGKRIVIDGIVLDVSRDGDGRILINGVDLFSLLPPEPAPDTAKAEEPATSWGLGTNDFTIRNSRARFSQPGGGELVLEIDSLTLQGFRTWTPDTPGQFAMAARLNEIGIDLSGQAKLFAEKIELQISSQLTAIELQKVERFTGPLGLAQGKGAMQADLENEVAIEPDGRIAVRSRGQLRADGLSLALPEGPALSVDKAVVTLDTNEAIDPDGSGRLTESMTLEGTQAHLALPELGVADLETTALSLSNIDLTATPSRALAGSLSLQLSAANGATDLDGLKAEFAKTTPKADLAETSLDLSGAIKGRISADLNVTAFSAREPLSGGAERLALSLSDTRFSRDGDGARIAGAMSLRSRGQIRADGLSLALPEGPALSVDKVVVTLDTNEAIDPDGSGRLTGSMTLEGTRAHLALPDLGVADLETTALSLSNIDLTATPSRALAGSLSLQLSAANGATDLHGLKAEFAETTVKADLAETSLDLSGATKGRISADLSMTAFSAREPLSGGAERLALSLSDTRLSSDGDGARIEGAMSFSGAAMEAQVAPDDSPALSMRLQSLALDASGFEAALQEEESATWRIAFGLEANGAAATVAGDQEGTLSIGQLHLAQATVDSELRGKFLKMTVSSTEGSIKGPIDANASLGALTLDRVTASADSTIAANSAVLSTFNLSVDDGKALDLRFGELALQEAEGAGTPAFRLSAGTLAGLNLLASTKLLKLKAPAPAPIADGGIAPPAGSTAAPGSQEASVEADTSTAPLPELRIGRFALADPARVTLIDHRQSPATTLNIAVDRLLLESLDSTDPAAKPALELAANINDFSTLAADGWLNPFGTRPNFDLTTKLENLELPTFSRYAAELLGVNLETGRLGVHAEGNMIEGVLDVETQLRLKNLQFSPLSPEDAARLSATAGVPVETAVGLLEDSDGLIELSIPIKGDIDNPQFDLDQVINKAIGNAIAGTIATTIKVIFPPALLISVISSASGEAGIQLAPAQFDAGTTALKPQGQELVDGLGTLLKERPKLSVTVCGRATTADLQAMLTAEIDALLAQRSEAYRLEQAAYRARLQPFIDKGVVDETGKLLVDNPPEALPQPPALAKPDRAAIADELVRQRQDELRDALVELAAQRTRSVRVGLSERLGANGEQVAECRPVFDPQDQEPPRLIVNF